MTEKKYKKTSYSFKNEDDIMNFGLYSGSKIIDVMTNETQYIDWCIKNFKGFKLCKMLSIKFEEIKKDRLKVINNTNDFEAGC